VSDLHLGARRGGDVLRLQTARAALLDALAGCERLVLLGDVIELRQGPVREALSAAAPVLREIGAALGPGREVVLVPGNHDRYLAETWLSRRAQDSEPSPLGLESAIDWRPGEALAAVAASLGPADVRAAYPGVWLREDVYAMHGHYADRHTTVPMFERLGAGVMARIVHDAGSGPATAEDYEATLSPIYAWIHAVAQSRDGTAGASATYGASTRAWGMLADRERKRSLRGRGLVLAFPAVVAGLNRAGIGPLRADLSGSELRRAALVALATVQSRLGVRAAHLVFGHTHRAGPLVGDDRGEWRTASKTALLNTGCWVHEPSHLGRTPSTSPYRPGFGAVVSDEGPPTLSNLLDGVVTPEELAGTGGAP
jgi:hypothetical protein